MLPLAVPGLRRLWAASASPPSALALQRVAAAATTTLERAFHSSSPASGSTQFAPASQFEPASPLLKVPAYKGLAVTLKTGQLIKVINTHGHQVCDFWAFATGSATKDGLLRSFMSMHHSHDHMRKHIPAPGDVFVTAQSKPILTFLEDSGPGIHDTSVAACSHELYEDLLGLSPSDPHDSCTANLHASLAALGFKLTDDPLNFYTPSPFNLWMNVPLRAAGLPAAPFEEWWAGPHPDQKPGDYVVLRAEMDLVAVMSACPASDVSPINGPSGKSHDVHCQVFTEVH